MKKIEFATHIHSATPQDDKSEHIVMLNVSEASGQRTRRHLNIRTFDV